MFSVGVLAWLGTLDCAAREAAHAFMPIPRAQVIVKIFHVHFGLHNHLSKTVAAASDRDGPFNPYLIVATSFALYTSEH
jgi:hypothetical protein